MGISVLGPLLVDDRPALSPRDQVVLEALVAARGEALSTEQLAEAMWGESPPASWPKLIPSSVLRIRKAVGSPAVVTTRHGYRLALDGDGVDAYRFERLVARGHQFLRNGEADRAVHALREALAIWRGRPLAELENWEPGRFEAERLDAMRREAEEAVLDATLRIGRHAEAVPEARARVAQEPLRERRWALLALAQYLSGDQADALATLRQARRHLADELGLDPGAELTDLERAVLRQDASLIAATALPEPSAENPYPGLRAFDVEEGEFFFGREVETGECLRRLEETGVLVVVGPSGSGKSSLARAGVMASLNRAHRPVELVGVCPHPVDALRTASHSTPGGALVVDQLEEVIAACGEGEQEELFKGLVEHTDAGQLVITIRADRLGDVTGHPALARLVERGLYLLGPMDEAALHLAINGPAGEAGLVVESGLVDLLVREVLEEPGALPLMAHALAQTWESREGRTLTVDGYRASGGIRGAVAQSAELVYEGLTDPERGTLHDLLLRLVSVASDGEPVRNWVPARQLTPGGGQNLVEVLVRARLVTVDDGVAALAHESLARAWPRLKG
ncbi:MAG TPA: AfsR/SARP family transcriptional regulator, partial [Intrasporangium sp.]|nr:AfsR/SARP family transcriptional regulator [Intrasporangium sp.]